MCVICGDLKLRGDEALELVRVTLKVLQLERGLEARAAIRSELLELVPVLQHCVAARVDVIHGLVEVRRGPGFLCFLFFL